MPTTVNPIDTKDRAAVVAAYTNIYLPTVGVTMGWTGVGHPTCTPGATSSAYRDATIQRVNYYRAMAGLPGDITLDGTLDTDWQSCALMQAENYPSPGDDPHNPPSTWDCYTAGGATAASKSNLSFGAAGAEAIGVYLDDSGNSTLGHRRWVLYPIQTQMATGSVSAGFNALGILLSSTWSSPLTYAETVLGNGWLSHPSYVQYVCWPPPRYCPYQLLPSGSKYWSLSPASVNFAVDFSAATVTMTKDNGATPVTTNNVQALVDSIGDKTLRWDVPNISYGAPGADTDYEVTIGNVGIGNRGQKQTFTYTVTVINP